MWIIYFPRHSRTQYKIAVPKTGTVLDAQRAVAKVTKNPVEKMWVADNYNSRFYTLFHPNDSLTKVMDRDILYFYQLPIAWTNDNETIVLVTVYNRQLRFGSNIINLKSSINVFSFFSLRSKSTSYSSSIQLFGRPFVIPIPRTGLSYDDLYTTVLRSMA